MDKRIFIGVNIPENQVMKDIRQDFVSSLNKAKIKWVPPDNYHITFYFLGDTPEEDIPNIQQQLHTLSEIITPFSFRLSNVGLFKNLKHPRVLWMGIQPNESLQMLHQNIEEKMVELGYAKNAKGFKPHLTFGRVKKLQQSDQLKNLLEQYQNYYIGEITIDHITLFESTLTKQGAVYQGLTHIPFRG